MKNTVTRACAWVSLALLTYAPPSAAQSLEVFAGGKRFVDSPASEVPLLTGSVTFGPDGRLYVVNRVQGKLFRFDPSTSTITTMPGVPGHPDYTSITKIAVAQDGTVFAVLDGRPIVKLDLAAGTMVPFAGGAYNTPNCVGSASAPASYYYVGEIAPAPGGRLYVPDAQSNRVCVVDAQGNSSLVAGTGVGGFSGDGGDARLAKVWGPISAAVGPGGNLYIADQGNNRIRKVTVATGIITTIAGNGNSTYNGDGIPALSAAIGTPESLAVDAAGNVFVYDNGAGRVRRIDAVTGIITSVAGNGAYGFTGDGGPATVARIGDLDGIAIGANGDLFLGDTGSGHVRRVSAATGIITSILGNGEFGFCGESAPRLDSCLLDVFAVAANAQGSLFISDAGNYRIRKVDATTGLLSTIAGLSGVGNSSGDFGPAIYARLGSTPAGVATDAAGNLYLSGGYDHRIRRIDAVTGIITTIAGTGAAGNSGDGGLATAAGVNSAAHLVFDAAGNLYFSDSGDHRVRKITAATGKITTVAGWGNPNGALGDGGPATSGALNYPRALAIDAAGNLLISDANHARIRKVTVATGIITTFAGNGTWGETGDGGPATAATIGSPEGIAVDGFGNVYLISATSLRRIDASTGIITRVAGGLTFATADGLQPKAPSQMTFDRLGNLYVADSTLDLVFRITGLPHPAIDDTPPTVTPQLVGTSGDGGWYRSNVQLTWAVSDAESSISFTNGCGASSVTTDTSGVTFTCSATSGGGTTTSSVTIKRDVTPPTLTFGARSPAADANGWNSGDVTIPFTTSDTLSGVFSTSSGSPITITGEGANLVAQVVVTDSAGNSATFTSPAVKIDRSAPEVVSSITGTAGNDGWYRSDVQVSWTVTDSGSPSTKNGCSTSSVLTDTAEAIYTCTATSAGGTTSKSVTIKRDATPPALTFDAASPAADENGWRAPPVSVPFNASDAMSGVATTSSVSPLAITQTGAGVTGQVIVTDLAGNSATFTTPAFNIDGTPPIVSMQVIGSGQSGWYRTDVQIVWSVTDHDSQMLTQDCENVTLTTDTAGTTYTCSGTSTGGSVTQSVTIKRDATPPTLVWSAPSPGPNAAGWFTSNVEFSYTTEDATSGLGGTSQVTPGPVIVTEDGVAQTNRIYVWDKANNQAVFITPPVNIDHLPAVVQPLLNGAWALGPPVWHNDDVQLHWNVFENQILSSSGCEDRLINTDTAGTTFTCSVTSGAGTTTESVTIKRDATPPVLTFGTPSPAPNVNGWNKTNVSIPFTRSDAMSGLASTSTTSPIVLNTEGADLTRQVVVTDLAGNSATYTTVPRNIDKAAPYAEIEVPVDGQTYGFYADVVAQYECVDLSLVSCTGPAAIGELVNTKTAGSRTFKITAKDQSLFTTTHTHTFNVASAFNFDGFLGAANDPPTLNLVARGSLVPIRFRLPDGRGGYVSNTAAFSSATVSTLSCGSAAVSPLNDAASGPAGISYDAGSNLFTYNWQTTASWTGCRKLVIKLKDNSTHELRFKFQ